MSTTMMRYAKWFIIVGGSFLAAVILLAMVLNRPSSRSPVVIELARAVRVRDALHFYAIEHDDNFPRTLRDLPAELLPPDAKQFHDPVTKQSADWLYYAGYPLATDVDTRASAGNIILASPNLVNGHQRIVIYADTTGEIIEEDKFVSQLSKQLNSQPPSLPSTADARIH